MSDLRAILRSTWLLAALGSVVAGIQDSCSGYYLAFGRAELAGIRDSCSGYVGFWP